MSEIASASGGAASSALETLVEEAWETYLADHPRGATTIGETRYDDRLEDVTAEGRAARRERTAELLARAEALTGPGPEAPAPDSPDAITASVLHDILRGELDHLDADVEAWSLDPLDGIPLGLLLVADYQRLETPGDGERMAARWEAMAGYVDAALDRLRRALDEGRVPARAPAARVADQLDDLLALPDGRWPLLRPARDVDDLPGWSETDRTRFRERLGRAVEGLVRPALERYRSTVVDEVLPVARGDDAPGLCAIPGGEAAYRALVRAHTTLDVEPDELHRLGLAEIERIDAEMVELAGRTVGASDLEDALARLRLDPALYFETRDEVRAVAERSLERATAAIPHWFGRLPQAPCVVVVMGPHEEDHSTIAYYRQPAADGSRPGEYHVDTSRPEARPRYEAEVLAFHEAVPGHHLQAAIQQELTHLPAFRRHLGPNAYFEGWALYVERLAEEMGLYSGDLDRIGVLSFDAWRAGRLVVDTGMHALGWSRDEAVAFLERHTALAHDTIAAETDRYIAMPGQALSYKTGQIELLRLRRLAEERLGAAFDIRAFHDAVLAEGAVPLATLREIVERWLRGASTA